MGKKKSKKKNNNKYVAPKAKDTVKVEDATIDTAVSNDADQEIVVEEPKAVVAESVVAKVDKTKSKKITNHKKEKKEGLGKKAKAVVSELKKVTWPTFGELSKQTGIVLGFCLVFVVILLGLNSLFGWLFSLVSDIL